MVELLGSVFWAAVACPYADVAPNSKNTLTDAPAGLTAPLTTAVEVLMPLALPVTGWAILDSNQGPLPYQKGLHSCGSAPFSLQTARRPRFGPRRKPARLGPFGRG